MNCSQSPASNVVVAIPIFQQLQLDNNSIITTRGSVLSITINSFAISVGSMNPGDIVTITYNASFIPIYNPIPSLPNVSISWDTNTCAGKEYFITCITCILGISQRSYNGTSFIPPISALTSTVGYLVWHDSNGDGIYAGPATEPGIASVAVQLLLNGLGK